MDCLFCKIINKEIPSYTIYEDELVKVFLDVNPKANGHCLIVPKKHYQDINDIDLDTIKYIFETAKNIYKLLNEKLNPNGIALLQNNGCLQEIKHFHLHLIPKYKEDNVLKVEEVYKKITN